MAKDKHNNAWAVKYRLKRKRKGKSEEWLTQTTYPALDVIDYNGETIDQFENHSFDIGQGRAAVEARRLQSDHGKDAIETRVDLVYFQPFDKNPPNGKITLIARFDNTGH
jgi:hypothetical protein